ncbi:MAG: right-handed parallel beta-helix repeat-containing protein, partial [Flavobacteriaceae bacterium]
TENSLPASTINVYEGFSGESNSASAYTLSGFFAIGATGSKTTVQSWEGDQTLSNNESLTVTTGLGTFNLTGDGDNTGLPTINPFNSTHFDNTVAPVVNNINSHGVDLDTYDVSPFVTAGETSVTTNVGSGQDFVILNTVTLKVPSNLTTGIVFEDVNYGGGAGRNRATAPGVPIPNATVELYDGGGSLVETTTTNAAGRYVFAGMANGTYTVRVVNNSVRSTRTGGAACTTCIPVQTFKTDFVASLLIEDTNSVGGEDPSAEDPGPGTLTGAQSVSTFTILNEGIAGMDFGYNFNTIVNTNKDGQGSLEQFIINSNALDESGLDIVANAIFDPGAGEDVSIFMIPPTGDALGRAADSNYASGIFDIETDPLTSITADNTHIDGRTQTAYSGNTNTGTVGAGGTNVGVSANALPNYDLPEVQVHDKNEDTFIVSGTATVIRNMAIYADDGAGILLTGGSMTAQENLLGVDALGANDGKILYGVEVTGGVANVDGNYITTNEEAGVLVNGGTSTIIQNNHITSNGDDRCFDNITITGGSGVVVQNNLIELSGAMGIDGNGMAGSVTITENTITSAGQDGGNCSGAIENAGIHLDGSNSSITSNIIYQNGGAGIVLGGGNTSGNLISQNSIYANGTSADALGIDIDQADGMGDGVTLNDTGDADAGPNGAANFPIITAAFIEGPNLILKGWSRPGANIEVFLTDTNEGTATEGDNQLGMSNDYGEGQIYIGSAVEGSGSDLDAGSSVYTDADGNTDNTNQFHLQIPYTPSLDIGFRVTATATVANTTSEFSPVSIIKIRSVITNRRITYRVNPN